MSEFYEVLESLLGDADAIEDIRVTVRRCWFYDFIGHPVRMWQGQGKLFTTDGNEWLGSIDADGIDHHRTPTIQDGRDGTSANYTMTLDLVDFPGMPAMETYDAIKAEQWRVANRAVTCYLAIFQQYEGLRPATPLAFFKELTMMSPKFSEKLESDGTGKIIKRYSTSVLCRDGNFGRSNVPGGTYADSIQKERAKESGYSYDRGCEFLALLANRTYQLP